MPKPVPANKDKMNLYASLPNTGAPAGMKMSRTRPSPTTNGSAQNVFFYSTERKSKRCDVYPLDRHLIHSKDRWPFQ